MAAPAPGSGTARAQAVLPTPYVDLFTEFLKSRNPGRRIPEHTTKLWILAHRFEETKGCRPPRYRIWNLKISSGFGELCRFVTRRPVTDPFTDRSESQRALTLTIEAECPGPARVAEAQLPRRDRHRGDVRRVTQRVRPDGPGQAPAPQQGRDGGGDAPDVDGPHAAGPSEPERSTRRQGLQ